MTGLVGNEKVVDDFVHHVCFICSSWTVIKIKKQADFCKRARYNFYK